MRCSSMEQLKPLNVEEAFNHIKSILTLFFVCKVAYRSPIRYPHFFQRSYFKYYLKRHYLIGYLFFYFEKIYLIDGLII